MPLRGEAARKTYTRHRPIARSVWIASHEILGENCIQKTYEPAGREDSIAFAEPRLLIELDHPNITPLREAQFDPDRQGHVTLVMRYYPGGSVFDALHTDSSCLSTGKVVQILQGVTDALVYLHVTKGCLHRDIKPKNILLSEDHRLGYLSDFGSAVRLDPATNDAALIRTTLLYQAPEGVAAGRLGPPADVYALGLTAFEMVNGLLPYADLDVRTLDRRVNLGQRALPSRMLERGAFAPHVPDALYRIIRRTVDADPFERPSASALLRELRALQSVDWRRVGGEGLTGTWLGRWPPRLRTERQVELQVSSRLLRAGRDRGQVRVVGAYRTATSGGWRSVGIDPITVSDHDVAALSAFFKAIDAKAASRWPA